MTDYDCQKCGACCVDQLVVVYPADDVPAELTQRSPRFDLPVMRKQLKRCVALEGKVGIQCSCRIYERRPVMCAAFAPGSWMCQDLRRRMGLEP
jgi:Fe-S-cluster containining protein